MNIDLGKVARLRQATVDMEVARAEVSDALAKRANEIRELVKRLRIEKGLELVAYRRDTPGGWVEFTDRTNTVCYVDKGRAVIEAEYIEEGRSGNPKEVVNAIELTDALLGPDWEKVVWRYFETEYATYTDNRERVEREHRELRIRALKAELAKLESRENAMGGPKGD